MSATCSSSSRLLTIAQLSSTGSNPSSNKSIHLCGTLVRLSARFWQDFTSFTSMVSPYSFASDRKVPNRRLTNISPAPPPPCSHVLFQLKRRESTCALTSNQWPSVTLSPPTLFFLGTVGYPICIHQNYNTIIYPIKKHWGLICISLRKLKTP